MPSSAERRRAAEKRFRREMAFRAAGQLVTLAIIGWMKWRAMEQRLGDR